MKNAKTYLCALGILGILAAGNATATNGSGEPIRSLPRTLKTGHVSVPHELVPLVALSGVGKAELDLTAHQIIFTDLGDNGGMHVKLFKEEEHERLPFSIVHTVQKIPFQSRYTYRLTLAQKEKFTIIYFREDEGRVTIKRLSD